MYVCELKLVTSNRAGLRFQKIIYQLPTQWRVTFTNIVHTKGHRWLFVNVPTTCVYTEWKIIIARCVRGRLYVARYGKAADSSSTANKSNRMSMEQTHLRLQNVLKNIKFYLHSLELRFFSCFTRILFV